jgi:hypothetical protein
MAILHLGLFLDGDECVFDPGYKMPRGSYEPSPAGVENMRVCWEANRNQIMDAWYNDPDDDEGWHQGERPWAWWLFVADRPQPASRRDEPRLVREIERRLEQNSRRRAAAAAKKKETPK